MICRAMKDPLKLRYVQRFMGRIRQEGSCWLWVGHYNPFGYGNFWWDGRYLVAHRVAYRIFKGVIEEDEDIHHMCKNRGCVNPEHLVKEHHNAHQQRWHGKRLRELTN